MTVRDSKLFGVALGVVATFVAVNGLGALIGDGLSVPGSAQKRSAMEFTVSLLAMPFGLVTGG